MIRKENRKQEESMKEEVGVGARKMRREGRRKKMRKTMKKDKLLFIGINCFDMYAN